MRIVTVCRMNQARSPFAQAVLERNFPEDQISSTGVSAYVGTPIMESVVSIAKSWGVPVTKKSSTPKEDDLGALLNADLVITADNEQAEIIRGLGYAGELRSFEEIITDKDFIPVDPEGLSSDAMARELGKVGALTLRAAIDKKGYAHTHEISAVIPHGVTDLAMALTNAQFKRTTSNAILIDADLRAPIAEEIDELELERVFFDIDHLAISGFPKVATNQILTHVRQIDFPEKHFLSPTWRNALAKLADDSPVVILTAPRHSRLRRLADSYLASYMADKFGVISC
jgi:protein-tyrosine-phosphatase